MRTDMLDALPLPVALVREGEVVQANAAFRELAAGRPLAEVLGVAVEALNRAGSDLPGGLRGYAAATADGHLVVLHPAGSAALTLLAELPEKNPGPVCRIARDGTLLTANAAARAFLGGERGSWLELCPGMTPQLWQRIVGSGSRVTHEAERGGLCVLFTHVRSDDREVIFAYGADITARRRGEQELAEVARFPEMNPGPVLRLDSADGTVLMANAAARALFGADVVGGSWFALCPGMNAPTWAGFLAAPGPVPYEARIADRDFVFAHRHDVRTRLVFVFGADVTAQKKAEGALRQAERMATLGTLAAGVAHELNNPAAAARRAADHLQDAFTQLTDASMRLRPTPELRVLEERARARARQPADLAPLERADLEAEVEEWLDERGVADPYDLAPALIAQGLRTPDLQALDGDQLATALSWLAATFRVHSLAYEIGEGAGRISEIVGALKSYSYLGQAPVQAVDVREGLDNTLVILRNKLKGGIEVRREYAADLPAIEAYGGELNQVWTNLLDNAADALGGAGVITIRASYDAGHVTVAIADDGPGIPRAIQQRVFDPFFTTKPPGKGTGLGLSTTYTIVTEKHGGSIAVDFRPGRTVFTVRLPRSPATAD